MFYQNNNDYMRDAFFYSVPQNSTYQNGWANGCGGTMNNMQTQMCPNASCPMNSMGNNMMNNSMMTQSNVQRTPVSSMYPQVYRIINPVANRVISNSNCQFLTEDGLNNMVDTVYNIVEGDVSTLSNTMNSGDDTVTQGPSRTTSNSNTNTNANTSTTTNSGTRQTSMSSESSRSSTTISSQNNRGENQLLRDLIKIIIIKEILSRQMGFSSNNTSNTQMNNANFATNSNNFIDPRIYGLI